MVPLDLWPGCEEWRALENVKGDRLALTATSVAPQWRQEVVDYVGVVQWRETLTVGVFIDMYVLFSHVKYVGMKY